MSSDESAAEPWDLERFIAIYDRLGRERGGGLVFDPDAPSAQGLESRYRLGLFETLERYALAVYQSDNEY